MLLQSLTFYNSPYFYIGLDARDDCMEVCRSSSVWVNFMEITKGKWSRYQSLGFYRCDWSPDSILFYDQS